MKPRISDHALLRFIERAGGHDIERLRQTLQNSLSRAGLAAASVGEATYQIKADGLRYIVKNDVVTTILFDGGSEA
jgi:hypothetical protein